MATMNLTTVETVENGNNGYPKSFESAVVGFSSIEQAEEFAERTGGRVEELHRKEGWSNWERCGWITQGYDMSDFFEHSIYFGSDKPEESDFMKTEVAAILDNSDDFMELEDKIQELHDMWDKIEALEENEMLAYDDYMQVQYQGPRYAMSREEDSSYYCIAVVADAEKILQEL